MCVWIYTYLILVEYLKVWVSQVEKTNIIRHHCGHQRTTKFYVPCRNYVSDLPSPLHTTLFHPLLFNFILSHISNPAEPPPSILSRQDFSLVSITGLNRASICSLSVPFFFLEQKICGSFFFKSLPV